jgi:hypothetical protein
MVENQKEKKTLASSTIVSISCSSIDVYIIGRKSSYSFYFKTYAGLVTLQLTTNWEKLD